MSVIVLAATQLELPWPPSLNGYWRPVNRGRHAVLSLTKRARVYRSDVATAIRAKLGRGDITPYAAPVRIDVELRAPNRRTRDLDNHLKGLFDALTHAGIWIDDSLVDEMTVRRGRIFRGGRALVFISPLDPTSDPDSTPAH